MKKYINPIMTKVIFILSIAIMCMVFVGVQAQAKEDDSVVVVSLGDSYSSGEGIEPFYGQEKDIFQKWHDEDWLAHRSTKSWPSQLEIPGMEGITGDYKADLVDKSSKYKWYFQATSGAETKHILTEDFTKEVYQTRLSNWIAGEPDASQKLKPQISVFDEIQGEVDYVTVTIGGNDMGFADVIRNCVVYSSYVDPNALDNFIDKKWNDYYTSVMPFNTSIKQKIKRTYQTIAEKAGPTSQIIVAGYPKLLNKAKRRVFISGDEVEKINENVSKFNDELNKNVGECKADNINISFVDVEQAFEGHEAYSDDPWINAIIPLAKAQDLNSYSLTSAYSMHPNEKGAEAYAKCVSGELKGVYQDGYVYEYDEQGNLNLNKPLSNVKVELIQKKTGVKKYCYTDEKGHYNLGNLKKDEYTVKLTCNGYKEYQEERKIIDSADQINFGLQYIGICSIGETLYSSLQEAVENSRPNDTIYIYGDDHESHPGINHDLTIVATKDVDVGSTSGRFMYNSATLTLKAQEGCTLNMIAQPYGDEIINNDGVLNIEDGVLLYSTISWPAQAMGIWNKNIVNINTEKKCFYKLSHGVWNYGGTCNYNKDKEGDIFVDVRAPIYVI